MKTIDQNIVNQVVELYKEIGNASEVARRLGYSNKRVWSYLQMSGIDTSKKPKCDYSEVKELHKQGFSNAEIARRLNVPYNTVGYILFKMRSNEETEDAKIDAYEVHPVENPIFYVKQTPTYEKKTYHGKKYVDATLEVIGM